MFSALPLHAQLLAAFAFAQLPLFALVAAADWARHRPRPRPGPDGAAGGDLLVLLAGVLIAGSGVASLFTEPGVATPPWALALGSICFTLAGAAVAGAALGRLVKRVAAAAAPYSTSATSRWAAGTCAGSMWCAASDSW